jgi:hypothetical protein
MIDLNRERVLPLERASKLRILPRRRKNKRPHPATLYRWAQRGCRGVRLETIRVGGTLCTSVEAIQRFCNRLSQADSAGERHDLRTASTAADRAAQTLATRGI